MSAVSRILCGVDFTDANRSAFDWAVRLARASGAELSLVHAVPRDHSFSWKARERVRDLADLRHAALADGVSVGVSVQHGDPAKVLLRGSVTPVLVLPRHDGERTTVEPAFAVAA